MRKLKTGKAPPQAIITGKDFAPTADVHQFNVEKEPRKSITIYSEKVALTILNRMAAGESLQQVCKADGMPTPGTVHNWTQQYPAFEKEYRRARDLMADAIAAKALEKATAAHEKDDVPGARLAFDGLRWYAGKVAPQRWGEKVEIEQKSVNININAEITDNERVRALAGLLAKTKAEREP